MSGKSYYDITREIRACAKSNLSEIDQYLVVAGLKTIQSNETLLSNEGIVDLLSGGDEVVAQSVKHSLFSISFEDMRRLAASTDPNDLDVALSRGCLSGWKLDGFSSTPRGIAQLALAILDIKPNDKVLDCCSGTGTFLLEALSNVPSIKASGVELNPAVYAASVIRARHANASIDLRNGDAFVVAGGNEMAKAFDKAFSNYPWGLRTRDFAGTSEYIDNMIKGLDHGKRPVHADWAFNKLLMETINDSGKAVAIMSAGSAFVGQDASMRKHFIENGWISAIVALPSGAFAPYSGISTCLVVLSRGCEAVRFVDATDLGSDARRSTELDKKSIEEILARLNHDSGKSRLVTVNEIAARDFDLCAERYVQEEIVVSNGVRLETVVERITRGANLSARKLDELTCAEDTGISYLNVKNVNDGSIDDELPSLRSVDSKLEKYLVENGSLVLSKAANAFKFAVAEIPEGRKVIASSNLYIIDVDKEKMDPYFLAAFLASPTGRELLSRAAVGTTLLSLPVSSLNELPVPCIPLEKQRPVANAYRAKLDEIKILKLQLDRCRQEVADIYDEEG